MALSSCNNKSKNVPCQIIVYDEASTTKAYLISYNGKDSIETICGRLSFDLHIFILVQINFKSYKYKDVWR